MRTAKEMRDFAAQYSVTNKFLISVKLERCPFEDIEAVLKPDEDVLFCFGALFEKAVALTNYRLINAETRLLSKGQNGGVTFFSYENINSVSSENMLLHIKTIGDEDLQYGNIYKEKITSAVTTIDDIVKKYKNAGNAATVQVVQQASAADELKKFKELLDMGVISQEEFDAKKKQLLGL